MSLNPSFCPRAINPEGCTLGASCQLRHDIRRCSCSLVLLVTCFESHIRGQRHRKLLAQVKASQPPSDSRNTRGRTRVRCEECNRDVPESQLQQHTEQHTRRERVFNLQTDIEEAERDKNGIIVSRKDGIDFGIVELSDEDKYLGFTLLKEKADDKIALSDYRLASSPRGGGDGERFTVSLVGDSRWIHHKDFRTLLVHFHPSEAGIHEDTAELVFFDFKRKAKFAITRRILANVGSRADHESLRPTAPYSKRQRKKYVPFSGELNFSLRPPVWTPTKWKQWLPKYEVPANISEALSGSSRNGLQRIRNLMPSGLQQSTYVQYFQTLIYAEEVQLKQDLDGYALEGAQLVPAHPRYKLEVEGLQEGRPSVLVGDFILVRHTGAAENAPWEQGCVHQVYEKHVSLRFGGTFSTYRGNKFDVRFVFNRLPLRRMHHALTNKNDPPRLLFPGLRDLKTRRRPTAVQMAEIIPFNRDIGSDEEQLETVAAIINLPSGSPPFIVFGPPGTGKTVTIAETIKQLLDRNPEARILVCTPSNSAADTVALRLVGLGKSVLFRLNSLSRKFEDLPKILEEFSLSNDNKVFAIPPLEDLVKYRVVVSTCISGGVPVGLGVKRGHYSHIFIDEAGQANEPEVMIPIKTMADRLTNVILAGDPEQLGPIVTSPVARSLGLGLSYLSRLRARPIYSLDTECPAGGRGITIVKLVKNFRTHPSILEFSNAHFYGRELQAVGNPALTHSLENWEELPKKNFPVVFHNVVGKDEREASSPSFFNRSEATEVKRYCQLLIGNRKNAVRAHDIIVITPYHAQVMKLRQLFSQDRKLEDIRIGSVEQFQGQESRVVIVTTVRSNEQYVSGDVRSQLGFVAQPQRMNVALTRAQALLIVVGNSMVLGLDPFWRSFIDYVHKKGGWRGKKLGWNPSTELPSDHALGEMEETMQRLKAFIATTEFDLGSDDEDENAFEERGGPRRDNE